MGDFKKAFLKILIWVSLLGAENSYSQQIFEFYTGVRQMGMGGAAIAVVNDETALLINPAALGKLRNQFVTLVDPEFTLDSDFLKFYNDGGIGAFFSPQTMSNTLESHLGRNLHNKIQLFPSVVFPNFGFGLFAKYSYDGIVSADGSTFSFDYTNDIAAIIGYSLRLFDGRLKLGFSGKAINRAQASESVPTTTTGMTLSNLVGEGVGLGADVGLIFAMPWAWLPQIAAVWRDVGGTTYDVNGGFFFTTDRRPAYTPHSIDVGFAVSPILGKRTRAQITVDYRDVLSYPSETRQMRRIHIGTEVNLSDIFFIRGGLNQGYYTFGLEFATQMLQLQLALFGEEVGTPASPQQDRRFTGKFVVRF